MRIACWVPTATNTYSEYVIQLFHCNSGYTNAPRYYVCMYIAACVGDDSSSVSVVTRLQGGRIGKRGFGLRRGRYFFTAPQLSDPPYSPSSPLYSGHLTHYGPRRITRSLSVTTHLCFPSCRMCGGAVPLLPYAFMT
jgi:hypothetical protein